MSLFSSVTGVLTAYARGPHHYIRTITSTGGNSELGVKGTQTIVDTPCVIPVIFVNDNLSADLVVKPEVGVTRKKFVIFFSGSVTESLVKNAEGIIAGGTYDSKTGIVTGGLFYVLDHTTEIMQYLDNDTACGIQIIGVYK